MEQFSLEKYLANPERKIVTRDGKRVRIICTDRAGLFIKPVVALITLPNGDEEIKSFRTNGIETAGSDGKDDLFFASNKRTDWVNLYRTESGQYKCGSVHESEQDAKRISERDSQYITTIKVEWEE